jgi:hypothetical protein
MSGKANPTNFLIVLAGDTEVSPKVLAEEFRVKATIGQETVDGG